MDDEKIPEYAVPPNLNPHPPQTPLEVALQGDRWKPIPPMGPPSQIAKAYRWKGNRVMVVMENGNRIWFTPGEPHGDEELQAAYLKFLNKGKLVDA